MGWGSSWGRCPGLRPSWSPLLSAVAEELLFRAVIQEQLTAWLGVVLFAVAHLPVDRKLWPWPVFALFAGTIFATLYDVTGAVLAPITAHFVINAVNLRWLDHRRRGADSTGFAT